MLLQVVKTMNKLLVVSSKKITTGEYNLDISKDIVLAIEGNVILHDINNQNSKLDINVNISSKLDLYLVKKIDNDYTLNITTLNDAVLNLNMLILNENKHQVNINVNMIQNNSKVNISVRSINIKNNSNLDIVCKGYIEKDTRDNDLIEDLKGFIINNNDTIKISPIMEVNTNEVKANHLVTIGNNTREELFYLESLGLTEEYAKKLLIESFIKHNMTSLELEFLKLGGENFE